MTEYDFGIEGEIDPLALLSPEGDGFEQKVTRYSRENQFNKVLQDAAQSLLPRLRHSETRQSIERIIRNLGRQSVSKRNGRRLPSRSRHWRTTYELAEDVLDGFGAAYGGTSAMAPGFVIRTWRMWEDLIEIGFRSSGFNVPFHSQSPVQFGVRQRANAGNWGAEKPLMVVPDLFFEGGPHAPAVMVDAKYKGRSSNLKRRISEADLYEGCAFARAREVPRVILLYPRIATLPRLAVGGYEVFERVSAGGTEIWAADLEVRGISSTGALERFGNGLRDCISTVVTLMADQAVLSPS